MRPTKSLKRTKGTPKTPASAAIVWLSPMYRLANAMTCCMSRGLILMRYFSNCGSKGRSEVMYMRGLFPEVELMVGELVLKGTS